MIPYLDVKTEWRTHIPVFITMYLIRDFTRGVQNSIPPPLHMPEHDEQWTDEHARTHQCFFYPCHKQPIHVAIAPAVC
jgi:hypothetical protein